jgi:hypothetical protein
MSLDFIKIFGIGFITADRIAETLGPKLPLVLIVKILIPVDGMRASS